MIERRHESAGTRSAALYSPCGAYRYRLGRRWDGSAPALLFVLLNPSTATEAANDPTLARCERRARAAGFGGVTVCNLFAWRATDPLALGRVADPVGAENDAVLAATAAEAGQILCGWGNHGGLHDRGASVAAALRRQGRRLWHLGLTRAGAPRHPLYLGYDCPPQPWEEA